MPKSSKSDKAERKRLKLYHDTVAAVEQLAGGGIATGQTIVKSRLNEAPLARLKRLGRLNAAELTAANDIVTAYHMGGGVRTVQDSDLGVRGQMRPSAAETIETTRIDLTDKYRQWRDDLDGHPALAAAVAMLLDERPARQTERKYGWRNGTASRMLVMALRHMAALRGNTPRGARGWRLPERNRILEDAMQLARLVRRDVDSRDGL